MRPRRLRISSKVSANFSSRARILARCKKTTAASPSADANHLDFPTFARLFFRHAPC
jgi:hypothetical protein